MSADGNRLLTQLYVAIRVVRDALQCTLPIEVFYVGDAHMPAHLLEFFSTNFTDVTMIDITKVHDSPLEFDLAGEENQYWPVKVFAPFLSSFEVPLAVRLQCDQTIIHTDII